MNIAKLLRASIFSEENLQTTASENEQMYLNIVFVFDPADTGRKLNVHKTFKKTFRTSSERLMYVQFTSCIYGGITPGSVEIRKSFWSIEISFVLSVYLPC